MRTPTKQKRGRPLRENEPAMRAVTLRATPQEYERIRAFATRSGITISEAMRRCIFSASEIS